MVSESFTDLSFLNTDKIQCSVVRCSVVKHNATQDNAIKLFSLCVFSEGTQGIAKIILIRFFSNSVLSFCFVLFFLGVVSERFSSPLLFQKTVQYNAAPWIGTVALRYIIM